MSDYSFDLMRIFIGDMPLLFLLEIAFRTVVLYIYSLLLLRFFSKRSSAQLTPVDVLIIVALGSSVGDPMFYADVPLLHGMTVVTVVMGLRKLGMVFSERSVTAEHIIQGAPSRLVADGQIDLDGMRSAQLLRDEVFEFIREKGYRNLGQIERLYVETDGQVSIFPYPEGGERPGLPVEPPWEILKPEMLSADQKPEGGQPVACAHCGQLAQAEAGGPLGRCSRCGHARWIEI